MRQSAGNGCNHNRFARHYGFGSTVRNATAGDRLCRTNNKAPDVYAEPRSRHTVCLFGTGALVQKRGKRYLRQAVFAKKRTHASACRPIIAQLLTDACVDERLLHRPCAKRLCRIVLRFLRRKHKQQKRRRNDRYDRIHGGFGFGSRTALF